MKETPVFCLWIHVLIIFMCDVLYAYAYSTSHMYVVCITILYIYYVYVCMFCLESLDCFSTETEAA